MSESLKKRGCVVITTALHPQWNLSGQVQSGEDPANHLGDWGKPLYLVSACTDEVCKLHLGIDRRSRCSMFAICYFFVFLELYTLQTHSVIQAESDKKAAGKLFLGHLCRCDKCPAIFWWQRDENLAVCSCFPVHTSSSASPHKSAPFTSVSLFPWIYYLLFIPFALTHPLKIPLGYARVPLSPLNLPVVRYQCDSN